MNTWETFNALNADQKSTVLKACKAVSDYDQKQMYDDMLNDCFELVNICGYEYEAARALADIDPIAYRCGMSDYFSDIDMWIELDGELYPTDDIDAAIEALRIANSIADQLDA